MIREVSETGGKVIATGGGAILREENLAALRENGVLIWLDRPLADLLPTSDRPLADQAEKIKALYAVRRPLYESAADLTVPVGTTPENIALAIMEKLK